MRKAAYFSVGLLFLCLTTLSIIYYATVSDTALVNSFVHLTNADIEKAKEIIFLQFNQESETEKTLELSERDLNIAANHLLNRHIDSATRIRLDSDKLTISTSLDLNDFIPEKFINVVFELSDNQHKPEISGLHIGSLEIDDQYAGLILDYIINHTNLKRYYVLAGQYIQSIHLTDDKITLTYVADQTLLNRAKQLVSFPANPQILSVYQQRLAETIKNHPKGWLLSLSDLLRPLFELAYERSSKATAIDENRHVIFVVSSYVNKNQWQPYLSNGTQAVTEPPEMPVYAYKRIDLAQHFIASAALTSLGSSYLANLLGFKKEIKDSFEGGSGFSFIDLAADRAGMYFGKMATSSPSNARKMQRVMRTTEDYRAFIPDVRDLPDQIGQQDLIEHYQSVDSQAAQSILKLIDNRIKASPLYKSF